MTEYGGTRSIPASEILEARVALLEARVKVLENALSEHMEAFKPFVMKPIGAEGSVARLQQEHEIDVHRRAREALKSGGDLK